MSAAVSPGFGVQAGLPAFRPLPSPLLPRVGRARALAEVLPVHEMGLWLPALVPTLLGWPSPVS